MKRLTIIILIAFISKIYVFGQEQRYLSSEYHQINSLGYAYSEYDTISNHLYRGFYEIFSQAVNKTFGEDITKIKRLNELVSVESIDTNKIKSLCKINNLDAILVTKVYFLSRDFMYKSFLGLKEIYNPHLFVTGPFCFFIQLKMFDRHGKLILNSYAVNSDGNNANRSLTNGFKKALKKAEKLKRKKAKKKR